ncbi:MULTISPECIES: hypothetical protein [unclassified Snodgrassella]|uniref:hypothetical protein n=1 Tax=unclassified Snodgrassella TaxID=2625236 RepID=UPI0018DE88E3|nr:MULTISPECIES: hypothetical protein [unclassified Snodgrassella]MBI0068082.1 hypothetical protein [Snodgrassella sp. M0110]MBI0077277.1 hypothetical protein [Snodgrassella sp. M0118]MBI0079382.1 hypothetical protein [Snodgrassella sp. M0112]
MITRTKNKANYNQNENEFHLPDITFPAEALELWEENPKRFLMCQNYLYRYIYRKINKLKKAGLLPDGIFE